MKTVEERAINEIYEILMVTIGEIVPEANLREDLGADSLDITELIFAIEEEFTLEISEDSDYFVTVGDIVNYVKERVKG